ncbi:FimV/HubP family polar landmark protein [Salinisphaera sp. SPP-AMP-43]|uniref:FimV/HubP family polar landmark protein n=1 Tax=Salinisphaera sp. SPP-AMP-43 TaxID=3121288 RepID=UPI003C6DC5C3
MAVITEQGLRKTAVVAAMVALGYAAPAAAMEFGALSVHSRLDQPLDATLALKRLSAADRASLQVGIAPAAMFERFGIRRSSIVDRLQIDTRYDEQSGRANVHLSTRRPVAEPFVDFLLQVRTGDGRALREYTAMLDPAGIARPESSPAATQSQPAASKTQSSSEVVSRGQAGAMTHRVRAGETLWSIAAANTPADASVAQTMQAIYRANASAFGRNMAQLRGGAVLDLPSATRIRAIDASQAKNRAAQLSPATDRPANEPDVQASGQAPPASLEQQTADAEQAVPATAAESAPEETRQARLGHLSPPADTPWTPSEQRVGATSAAPAVADAVANTQPGRNEKAATAAAPGSQAKANATAGAVATAAESDTTDAATSPRGTSRSEPVTSSIDEMPPPRDVAAGGSGLSLRTLGLVVLLLLLALLGIRRWQARRYRPIELESAEAEQVSQHREDSAATVTEAPVAETATGHESAATPGEHQSAHTPAATAAGSGPGAISPDSTLDAAAASRLDRAPLESPIPDEPGQSSAFSGAPAADAVAAFQPASPLATPGAEHSRTDTDTMPAMPDVAAPETPRADDANKDVEHRRPASTEPGASAADGSPAAVDDHAPGTNADRAAPEAPPDRPRRAATNEEIEALAFESHALPQAAERQHDLGDHDQEGLSFNAETEEAQDAALSDDGQLENSDIERYGLEMIDPGEFDLYDPPSETAGQSDDDPNDSIEIRLDLARMYIDMDDRAAARELLEDVRQRGDEQQQHSATELLETL